MSAKGKPRPFAGHEPGGITCVVADDDHIDRLLARTAMSMMGISRIEEASDPESLRAALQKVENGILLIADRLGDTAGLELVRRLRWAEEPGDPAMAILLAAPSSNGRGAKETARNAGVDAVIGKPFSATGLSRTVSETLAHPRPFIEAESYHGPCRRINGKTGTPSARRRAEDQAQT